MAVSFLCWCHQNQILIIPKLESPAQGTLHPLLHTYIPLEGIPRLSVTLCVLCDSYWRMCFELSALELHENTNVERLGIASQPP